MRAPREPGASSALRSVSDRLAVPLPAKTRLLEEIASDLRSLSSRFVSDGLTPEEARRRAAEALLPDDETLAWLDRIHASGYRRVTERWSAERLRLAERILLVCCFVALVLVEARAILAADVTRYASPFLWIVVAAGAAVATAVVWNGFTLWVKGEHARARRAMRALLALSAAPVGVALAGTWFDVFRLAALLQERPALADVMVVRTLIQDAAMLSIAILFALVGAVGWLVFTQWIAVQEHAHRRALNMDVYLDKEV